MSSDQLDQSLSDQDRVLLVFGYLGPLALVSLIASRREFVKWHAKQGLALAAFFVVSYTILSAIHSFLDAYFWAIFGELFRMALWLMVTGGVVALLVCIVRGLEGERFKLPLLGELADRL